MHSFCSLHFLTSVLTHRAKPCIWNCIKVQVQEGCPPGVHTRLWEASWQDVAGEDVIQLPFEGAADGDVTREGGRCGAVDEPVLLVVSAGPKPSSCYQRTVTLKHRACHANILGWPKISFITSSGKTRVNFLASPILSVCRLCSSQKRKRGGQASVPPPAHVVC